MRESITELDQTGVLRPAFIHAFMTSSPSVLHVHVGPTRETATRVMEIADCCVRLLTDVGYVHLDGPQFVGQLDVQLATVVLKHGPTWVRCAAADTARRVSEARAVCAFNEVIAEYNKALELQL